MSESERSLLDALRHVAALEAQVAELEWSNREGVKRVEELEVEYPDYAEMKRESRSLRSRVEEAEAAAHWLSIQRGDLQLRVEELEAALREHHDVIDGMLGEHGWPPERVAPRMHRLREIARAALAADTEWSGDTPESRVADIKADLADTPPGQAPDATGQTYYDPATVPIDTPPGVTGGGNGFGAGA